MWRFFVVVFLISLSLSCCSRDRYEDWLQCSRDRNTNDYEGHDQCMRDRGWTEEEIRAPL